MYNLKLPQFFETFILRNTSFTHNPTPSDNPTSPFQTSLPLHPVHEVRFYIYPTTSQTSNNCLLICFKEVSYLLFGFNLRFELEVVAISPNKDKGYIHPLQCLLYIFIFNFTDRYTSIKNCFSIIGFRWR